MAQSKEQMPQMGPREIAELLPAVVRLQSAATVPNAVFSSEATGLFERQGSTSSYGGASGDSTVSSSEVQLPSLEPSSAAAWSRRPGVLMSQRRQLARGGRAAPPPLDPGWTAAVIESCRFKLSRFTAQV